MPDRIALAAVAGAHGVRGELRLKLFTESAENLARYDVVVVNGRDYRLLAAKDAGRAAIARLGGVNDRAAAEALRGALLEVDRSALPALEEGEYYHADLIGLPCVGEDGGALGTVVAVENFGAGDLLEIEDGEGRRSLLPFRPGVADLVDGRIVADRAFLA